MAENDDDDDDDDGDNENHGKKFSFDSTTTTTSSASAPTSTNVILQVGGPNATADGDWIIQQRLSTCKFSNLSAQTSTIDARLSFVIPAQVSTVSINGFGTGAQGIALIQIGDVNKTISTASTTTSTDGCNILFRVAFGPEDVGKEHNLVIINKGVNMTAPANGPPPPGPPPASSLTINSVILGMEPQNFTGNTTSTFNPFAGGVADPTSSSATSSTQSASPNRSASAGDSGSSKLNSGAIAGIVVSSVIGVFFLLVIFVLWRRKQNQQVSLENGIWSKNYFKNEDTMRVRIPSPTAQLEYRSSVARMSSVVGGPTGSGSEGDRFRASQFEMLTAPPATLGPTLSRAVDTNTAPAHATTVAFPAPSRSSSVTSSSSVKSGSWSSISSHRKPVPSMIRSETTAERRGTMSSFLDEKSSVALTESSDSSFESPGSRRLTGVSSAKASSYLIYPDPPPPAL